MLHFVWVFTVFFQSTRLGVSSIQRVKPFCLINAQKSISILKTSAANSRWGFKDNLVIYLNSHKVYWLLCEYMYSKTCLKPPLSKRPKIGFSRPIIT